MDLAKRALSQTIQLLWQQNKETRVTIVPFARDAYVPLSGGGLSYDYLGTLFTWRRSTTSGNRIGQILGYRNGSYVSATDIPAYMAQSAPIVASTELSLYNYYNYYKIRYSDIYEDDGTARTDAVLSRYLSDIYAQNPGAYAGNFIQNVATGTPLDSTQLPYSMNDTGYESNTILDDLHRRSVILITDGQRSVHPDRGNPDITDPADPDYTVYTKPALLPDISDANVQDGVITVGLGEVLILLPHRTAGHGSG